MKKRLFSLFLCAVMLVVTTGCGASSSTESTAAATAEESTAAVAAAENTGDRTPMIPGTYTQTVAGRNGDLTLSVTVDEQSILSIEIGANTETAGISDPALTTLPDNIVASQSVGVDVITGATITSEAVLAAVTDCIEQAGGKADEWNIKTEKTAGEAVDLTADVIVVGGGGAGIAAAIAAAQEGASVIIIEKREVLGGNTLYSGAAWNAADPERQGKLETMQGQLQVLEEILEEDESTYGEYADTLVALKQEIRDYLAGDTNYMFDSVNFHIIQTYQGGLRQNLDGEWYYGDFDLVKTLCENSLDTMNWVSSWGVEISDDISTAVGALWRRSHGNTGSQGSAFFLAGEPFARNLGVEIMTSTAGKSLVVENDRVVGVQAEKSDGTPVTLHANKNVVMATGGYGGNPELVKEYNNYWPVIPEEITTNNVSTITGDGIFMCQDVGANLVGMDFVQLMPMSHPVTNNATGLNGLQENTLYVNKEGVRFVNEYSARDTLAAAAFAQTDGMFYSIDDADTAATRYTQETIDGWLEQGYCWTAETLEELGEQVGIDGATLAETVATYNSYVESGVDLDFGKSIMNMKIENAPFYITPHKPNIHHTMGGVQINSDAQVIDVDGNVISGLYAAGEVTGGIHAGNRLGGNAIADAFTFGRIAGTNAAK